MTSLNFYFGDETASLISLLSDMTGKSNEDAVCEAIKAQIAALSEKNPQSREFRPNAETLESFAQHKRGEGKTFNSIEDLMADLNAKD